MTQTAQDIRLDIVASLAGKVIDSRVLEAQRVAELHKGLRQMYASGLTLDELSSASGLTIAEIRQVLDAPDPSSDLRALAGLC